MFSEGIEKEHWLHFLMSLKENKFGSKWVDWRRYVFQQFQLHYELKIFSFLWSATRNYIGKNLSTTKIFHYY